MVASPITARARQLPPAAQLLESKISVPSQLLTSTANRDASVSVQSSCASWAGARPRMRPSRFVMTASRRKCSTSAGWAAALQQTVTQLELCGQNWRLSEGQHFRQPVIERQSAVSACQHRKNLFSRLQA